MWFKRAQKNRRLGRQYVLDVKLRSSQVRAKRARMAAVALGGVFAAVAGLYLAWQVCQYALNVLLYDNKAFAILDVDAQTDGVIAIDQLRRWTGIHPGQNLFALDLAGVRRNLQLVSLIQNVSLEKVLPHTLRLRVTERDPLAQLALPKPRAGGDLEMATFYLDSEGYVISPLAAGQYAPGSQPPAPDQLPTIVGVDVNQVQVGRRLDSPQVHAALELIQAFERSPMQGLADLRKIDVSGQDVLDVKTETGSDVTLGLDNLDQQILRWQKIFEAGQNISKAIATMDLAVSNGIPVTWVDATTLPPAPAKTPKPLRTRKKHV
jgi:cell division septal protein FtsQ